jgi:hypothetical protein
MLIEGRRQHLSFANNIFFSNIFFLLQQRLSSTKYRLPNMIEVVPQLVNEYSTQYTQYCIMLNIVQDISKTNVYIFK